MIFHRLPSGSRRRVRKTLSVLTWRCWWRPTVDGGGKRGQTAVVWLLFTLPLSLLEGVFSQNGPQRSRARRCCAAKRTLHGEDRSEILDKRERGGPKWTAKMAQSLTASDTRVFVLAGF